MKKMSMRLAALVLPLIVSSVHLAGQHVGDNATIILAEGTIKNMRLVLVIKSTPAAAPSKVGKCVPGEVRWQEADLVDRALSPGPGRRDSTTPSIPTVKTQVAIHVPGVLGFREYKVGVTVGNYREGGKCGPGFHTYLAQVVATE